MPFKKGQSGNVAGRPKGSKNKATSKLREMIAEFLDSNFEVIRADFKKLAPRDRAKFYLDLLHYGLPKLQSTSLEVDFEKLTDEQLDKVIESLRDAALKNNNDE